MSCLLAGALTLAVSQGFTLDWTHSVEKQHWREEWTVTHAGLRLDRAAVKGSGAGMEPGDGAVLREGWWEWSPHVTVPQLVLAASGATGAGWRICVDDGCRWLGDKAGAPVTLQPCP